MDANSYYAHVHKGGTATFLARVVDFARSPLTAGVVSSITYTIYTLDDSDPGSRTAVTGHNAVSLTVGDVITALVDDAVWTRDATGYNFHHTPSTASYSPFPNAGRRYLVEYRIQPTSGSVIVVTFKVYAT